MKHYTEEELYSYIDEELDESQMADIKSHLSECPECAEIVDNWLSCNQLFSTVATVQKSDEFTSAVMSRINSSEESEKPNIFKTLFTQGYISQLLSPTLQLAATIVLLLFFNFETSSTYSTSSIKVSPLTSQSGEKTFIIDPYNTESFSLLLEEI